MSSQQQGKETKIFISGSLSIDNLAENVTARLDNIIGSDFLALVGDAYGIDSSIQKYLKVKSAVNVNIYCAGNNPRNNLGEWDVIPVTTSHKRDTRAFFSAKDLKMADDCDYGLMIWDSKSTGTLSNVIELLKRGKKSVVFVNKLKEFVTVKTVSDLHLLISKMADGSILQAEKKINLSEKVSFLEQGQKEMFCLGSGVSSQHFPKPQ